jgi:hypothetical protein
MYDQWIAEEEVSRKARQNLTGKSARRHEEEQLENMYYDDWITYSTTSKVSSAKRVPRIITMMPQKFTPQ